jgi:hypothetical protein
LVSDFFIGRDLAYILCSVKSSEILGSVVDEVWPEQMAEKKCYNFFSIKEIKTLLIVFCDETLSREMLKKKINLDFLPP